MGIRPRHFHADIFNRKTGEMQPHGSVGYEGHNTTFLQDFMIALAPLFVCTWLFFWSLDILFMEDLEMMDFFCCFFFCMSLLIGAPPSFVDFKTAFKSFKEDPQYSLYQLLLVVISGFLVWYLISFFHIILIIDLLYYILVGLMYLIIKYTIRTIGSLSPNSQKPNYADREVKRQRRYKPSKPYREPQF